MLLGHKANVTSVIVLTVGGFRGEVSAISTTFHWASESMTHIWLILSVTHLQRSKGGPAETVSLMTHAAVSNGGEVQRCGIKDKALTIRALEAKTLIALSLLIFLGILILSSKTFSYQSIHSRYEVTHLSGSIRMELMELYVLSCSHASRGL